MAYSLSYNLSVSNGVETIAQTIARSASGRAEIDEDIGVGADTQVNIAIDVSEVEMLVLLSDQDVTIETNSGSEAADTLALTAGEPYIWYSGAQDSFALTTDVTAFFVTNAAGATARVRCWVVQDATP